MKHALRSAACDASAFSEKPRPGKLYAGDLATVNSRAHKRIVEPDLSGGTFLRDGFLARRLG